MFLSDLPHTHTHTHTPIHVYTNRPTDRPTSKKNEIVKKKVLMEEKDSQITESTLCFVENIAERKRNYCRKKKLLIIIGNDILAEADDYDDDDGT